MSKPKKEVSINAKIKLNQDGTWELFLANRPQVIKACLQMFPTEGVTEIELSGILKKKGKIKSLSKLGYFWAEIIPRITEGLIDAGWHGMDNDTSYLWLCKRFNGMKTKWNEKKNESFDEIITLSDLDDEQTGTFMNSCITFAQSELNIRFQSPEEYKEAQSKFC